MILAVLGRGLLPADTPVIRADDQGFLRGDACFDTAHVVPTPDGARVELLDEHLARFAASAARLDLPPVDTAAFAALAQQGVTAFATAAPGTEGTLRLVWSRGPASDAPVGLVTVAPVGSRAASDRAGVTLAALTNGQVTGIFEESPWLLAGVKSASYAQRMAAVREARARGCDEPLFVSADGFALDGATSGLMWREGQRLLTTDVARGGVLRSRTIEELFAAARLAGVDCAEALVTVDELTRADGAWLASASRGVVPVLGILAERPAREEVPVRLPADPGWTDRLRRWAGF